MLRLTYVFCSLLGFRPVGNGERKELVDQFQFFLLGFLFPFSVLRTKYFPFSFEVRFFPGTVRGFVRVDQFQFSSSWVPLSILGTTVDTLSVLVRGSVLRRTGFASRSLRLIPILVFCYSSPNSSYVDRRAFRSCTRFGSVRERREDSFGSTNSNLAFPILLLIHVTLIDVLVVLDYSNSSFLDSCSRSRHVGRSTFLAHFWFLCRDW
jgi:hypothetical protein